ncbi:MAG TPA: hypothetical protein VGX03_07890 [Candidatus Binatia bacterium]|jgi:hypothetical protein|nr:hypothetical protein [Candidatus Binatia bacterium]
MTDSTRPLPEGTSDLAEKIAQYLLRNPCDLIDTTRLMRRFRASVADVQQALKRIEQLTPESEEEPAC